MFPHSTHDDAWGVTRVPIAIIANGKGPTVIIEGGNHGDEHEGPIVIGELARELDPGEIQGRLILMPANNVHAVIASRRTSPIDGLNFNRTFPGDPAGTHHPADFRLCHRSIFPMADAFLDLHSGGSSLDFIPSAVIEPTKDEALAKRNIAAARAFDAPCTVVVPNLGDQRTATAAACRAGTRYGRDRTRRRGPGVERGAGRVPPRRAKRAHASRRSRRRAAVGRELRQADRSNCVEQPPMSTRPARAFSRLSTRWAARARRRARGTDPPGLGARLRSRGDRLWLRRNPVRPAAAGTRQTRQLLPGRRFAGLARTRDDHAIGKRHRRKWRRFPSGGLAHADAPQPCSRPGRRRRRLRAGASPQARRPVGSDSGWRRRRQIPPRSNSSARATAS